MMTPISFKEDASDNPNKGLGILKGCGLAGILWAGAGQVLVCCCAVLSRPS